MAGGGLLPKPLPIIRPRAELINDIIIILLKRGCTINLFLDIHATVLLVNNKASLFDDLRFKVSTPNLILIK